MPSFGGFLAAKEAVDVFGGTGGIPIPSITGGAAAPSSATGFFEPIVSFGSPFIVGDGNTVSPDGGSGPGAIIRTALPWIAAIIGISILAKKFL